MGPPPILMPDHTPQDFFDADRDRPAWVGDVPNFADFVVGIDHDVGAFEIKAQGTRRICLPSNLAHLLPTTALIIDDLYAHAGEAVADQCEVSLQFFRRSYAAGRATALRQVFTGMPRKAKW